MADKSQARRLIPVGDMGLLDEDQQVYIQCYVIASRLIPNGSKNATNTQILADRFYAARRRRR